MEPFLGQLRLQGVSDLHVMSRQRAVPDAHCGDLRKRRPQMRQKLRLQHGIQRIPAIFLRNVSANVRIENKRIRDFIGKNAVQANGYINVESNIPINHTERHGLPRAKLIIQNFFRIKIIYALILSGISAVSKSPPDRFKGFFNARSKRSRKNTRLRGTVICEFARLRADLHNFPLFNDHHALSVRNGDSGAV